MGRIRTFVAVDVGDAMRSRLASAQQTLAQATSDVKWVEAENLHVTLLFLGEVDERDLLKVCRAVQGVAAAQPAFRLEASGVGCFPNARRPRVVWAGIGEGASELTALHDALEPPLLELGCYRREDRPFTPHLTLGRTKSDAPAEALAQALPKLATWRGGSVDVRELRVYSSELASRGPTYTVLARAKLA